MRRSPSVERRPRPPDLRRSGSYSVPFASAWETNEGFLQMKNERPSGTLVLRGTGILQFRQLTMTLSNSTWRTPLEKWI
jgi:hypothetical protein